MCTVTFFPLQGGGFILTSNRDERLSRSDTLPPVVYTETTERLYYPRDQESSGTWIACSASGKTFCLLNGGFEYHKSEPPYRKSRGLVLLEMLQASDPETYLKQEDLTGIEPFTLVMVQNNQGNIQLKELRWDGKIPHLKLLDSAFPHIWSSATLYGPEIRKAREDWFFRWLKENPRPEQHDLLHFHRFGGSGDGENDLVMKRSNDRQTISITSVYSFEGKYEMCYEDLLQEKKHRISID
jgi:hypothetical protein